MVSCSTKRFSYYFSLSLRFTAQVLCVGKYRLRLSIAWEHGSPGRGVSRPRKGQVGTTRRPLEILGKLRSCSILTYMLKAGGAEQAPPFLFVFHFVKGREVP